MTAPPSDVWFEVFPSPRIPDVLAYVVGTWDWLQRTFASAVSFDRGETDLTDNLCEALEDRDRRRANGIDCDFQPQRPGNSGVMLMAAPAASPAPTSA